MELRNLLLLVSISVIGFCLLLYFQKDENELSVHLDQYKTLTYGEERSHSLEDLNQKIRPYVLDHLIQDIYEKNKLKGEKTRVMEIGTGNGRVLMELKKLFPEVEFYGINKEKTHTFYRRESFILTALKFAIFSPQDVDEIELPYVIFEDLDFGNKIPYNDNKFDLIFSQHTINYIKYKFELFNEILRILKPDGLSIHTDISGVNIYHRGTILEWKEAIAYLRKKGMEVSVLDDSQTLRFKKKGDVTRFPVTPHLSIPSNLNNIPSELRRPQMGYNLD